MFAVATIILLRNPFEPLIPLIKYVMKLKSSGNEEIKLCLRPTTKRQDTHPASCRLPRNYTLVFVNSLPLHVNV